MGDASLDPNKRAEASKERDRLDKEKTALGDAQADAFGAVNENFKKDAQGDRGRQAFDIAQMAGLSGTAANPDRIAKLQAGVKGGADLSKAAEDAGFSADEIGKLMAKALWKLSPQQGAGVLGDYGKQHPIAGAVPTAVQSPTALTPTAGASTTTGGASITPPAGPPAPPTPTEASTTKLAETGLAVAKDQADTLDDVHKALRVKGIKMDKVFLETQFGKQIDESTLDAIREGLFEYWLYSGEDRDKAQKALEAGIISPTSLARAVGQGVKPKEALAGKLAPNSVAKGGGAASGGGGKPGASAGKPGASAGTSATEGPPAPPSDIPSDVQTGQSVPGNATGGIVTGFSSPPGMPALAQISPAPGEALTSIGMHETIVPAGKGGHASGGGTSVRLDVNVTVEGLMDSNFQAQLKGLITDTIYDYIKKQALGRT